MKKKLLLVLCSVLCVFSVAACFFVSHFVKRAVEDETDTKLTLFAKTIGSRIESDMQLKIGIAENLAAQFGSFKQIPAEYRRNILSGLLKDSFESMENCYSAWTIWEPNALDGRDAEFAGSELYGAQGRFSACWFTDDAGESSFTSIEDYADTDWYTSLAQKNALDISEPAFDEDDLALGKHTLIFTIAVPVTDASGIRMGFVGFDIHLSDWVSLDTDTSVKNNYSKLISGEGNVLVSPNESSIGQKDPLFEKNRSVFDSLRTGTVENGSFLFVTHSIDLDKEVVGIVLPLSLRDSDSTWFVVSMTPLKDSYALADRVTGMLILTFSVLGCILILSFVLVLTPMLKPLITTADLLHDISDGEGDLTVRLECVGKDEPARIALYFNKTIEKIRNNFVSVRNHTDKICSAGTTLAADMEETAAAIHQITANIDSVKVQAGNQNEIVLETENTVQKMTQLLTDLNGDIAAQERSVQDSLASVEEMVASVRSVTQIVEGNIRSIEQLEQQAKVAQDIAADSRKMSDEMYAKSDSLLNASSVIQNISSQTNLLAMNAAIEAAHAGEYGQGFAVVADEIRKLAEESSRQSKAITSVLKWLMAKISLIAESAGTADRAFSDMLNLTVTVSRQEDVVLQAMQEQNLANDQVLKSIQVIDTVTHTVSESSQNMISASNALREKAKQLSELSDSVSGSMNEMAAGSVQINNAVQEVNQESLLITDSIKELSEIVSQYKL